MKVCSFIPALCIAAFSASCTHSPYPTRLVAADSIAEYAPLRAQVILDSLRPSIRQTDEAIYNYYRLMCVKAADKALKPLPNDDTIVELMRYYEKQEDKNLLPVAYYYMGRSYMVQYNYPQALRYFQKSLEIIDKSNRVPTLKSRLYNQMGEMFLLQALYDRAIMMYSASLECNKLYKDYRGQMFDMRDMALCYYNKKAPQKAEHFYLKALSLASLHKEEDLVADISCVLSKFYLKTGKIKKALKYIKPAIEYNDPDDQLAVLSISADIYMATGMTDSAYARYKRMMSIDDVHAKKFAFKRLADYYLMKNDAARSLSCTKGYEQMLDSISAQSATEELARMDAVFRNQQNEQQISRLKADKSNYQNIVIAVCAVVTFFILACLVIFFYLKMRRLSIRIKVEFGQRVTQDEHEHTDEFMRQSKESLRGSHLERIRRELQETDEYKMLNRRLQDESVTNKKLSTDEWRRLEKR